MEHQSVYNNKKSYADFLADRPFNNQKGNNSKDSLMNCLRNRLRIASNLEIDTEDNTAGSNTNLESDLEAAFLSFDLNSTSSHDISLTAGNNERVKSLYDTLLQLIDEFDATGITEIFRLLLERRSAIPLFVPQSKKHYLGLLEHVTLPGIDGIRLGADKTLLRVAVISCRPRNRSQTCDILKNVFNIDSFHSHDCTTGKFSLETMLAEIGCGCIVTEGSGSQTIQNVLVVHVIGDFKPLWPFLHRFADCYLIEDSTVESDSFFSSFMTKEKKREIDLEDDKIELTKKSIGVLWTPSNGENSKTTLEIINGFSLFHVEDQLSFHKLRSGVVACMKKAKPQPNFENNRRMLCDIPILKAEGYSSLECVSPKDLESIIAKPVDDFKKQQNNSVFLLQENFLQEAVHQEAKMENRLKVEIQHEEDEKIKKIRERRRAKTYEVEKNSLLKLFLNFLEKGDRCSRVLSIRMLEKNLDKHSEQKLDPLRNYIHSLSASYHEKILNNAIAEDVLESARQELVGEKAKLIKSALNMEHLWRELSHLYTDMESARRSEQIKKIPRLAAQHLLDGFSLELLDGDANMIRIEWVTEVLLELGTMVKGKRIFVLSVMGIQSSGKSTLLNTMFGIRMRTSVGQCTRGVNMQLLSVEGRPDKYDYILLLDTEGTRSPEYHGLPGSEKRDNQMATLSILLSDATIIIIPGENDAAVKEILPIVLMAYQGSQLAERNGGRLSSRMFFVYNRIDTKQKDKLNTIIETLGTSLHEAFSQVQKSIGDTTNLKSESPFANFNLLTSDSSGSDICILGNVKKQSEPPGDVPDEAYGKGLIQFREHIHQRVTNIESGKKWESRSIEEFSSYIEKVWTCICSANFILNFATVMEHNTFDKLDSEYKKIERKLAVAYEKSFENFKGEMTKLTDEKTESSCSTSMRGPDGHQIQDSNENSPFLFKSFEEKLRCELDPIENDLDKEIDDILKKRGREKWSLNFQTKWEMKKKDQAFNWKLNLKNTFDRLLNYENCLEKYKKKMRQEINKFVHLNPDVPNWTEAQKNKKFDEMFKTISDELQEKFPPKNIRDKIKKVYANCSVIKGTKIEIILPDKPPIESNQSGVAENIKDKNSFVDSFSKMFRSLVGFFTKKKQESIKLCCESVYDTVHRNVSGKLCYDDSIISQVIREVHSTIKEHKLTDYTVVQHLHLNAAEHLVGLMQKIEKTWETKNSLPTKFKSDEETMHKYFMMVSNGVAKTKLFAATMADTLDKNIILAFEKEMVRKTFQGIRNERWLYDARFMQKHMDLYLIDWLEKNKFNDVLDHIRNPKRFYEVVLHQLVAEKVPNVEAEQNSFKINLIRAIKNAAAGEVENGRAQSFVDELRKEFVEGYLQSDTLSSAFRIDCRGEYEDCDQKENKKEFYDECSKKLKEVVKKQRSEKTGNQVNYAKELSPKVVQYMKEFNDEGALPRCDAYCHLCKSLCIEAANHDTQLRPHDAIHQPGGVAGVHFNRSNELDSMTCSQSYEQDHAFFLSTEGYKVRHKYRDYATVFPGWKDPRINEELLVREYILATYNKEIAEKFKVKPSTNIPASYTRDLSSIKEKLQREITN